MAVNLDTRLPLLAVGEALNPAGIAAGDIAQRLDELRLDYENRKRKREADTERYMGEELSALTAGQPAVERTEYVWQQPRTITEREAIPARQPTIEDMQRASIAAMMRAGDLQGAFDAMKAARSGQVSQMKPFGGETKIGSDGQAYAFNQASGRYEPTGFYPQAAPEKQEKPVQVRTSRGKKTEKPVAAPAPSLDESKNAGFYQRMLSVSEMLNRYELNGKPTEYTSMVEGIPVVGKYLQRGAMTPDQAQYRNAAMAWIRAKLRKESGAVIGDDEAKSEYETYFPLPNDGPEVIEQKRQLREIAEDEMRLSAGKAASLVKQPAARSIKTASDWLKTRSIKTQQQFAAEVAKLKKSGWTDDEIRQAVRDAGL